MRYAWATALAASAALCIHPAHARDTRYRIDIGAVDAADALAMLSAQTGISVASEVPLPRRPVVATRGQMTAGDALDRMFRGLDLRAVRVGPRTFRIVPRKRVGKGAVDSVIAPPAEDIVVTGRKQAEMLSAVPAPVTVYVPDDDARSGAAATTRDVARATDGLTLTNSGAGTDRPFIRGVADSAFDGFSQSTVAIQLDDARLTYNAPEPGLRLVDVARVEVLKGPQGPLYGTGALGGVYRIVTNRPVLGRVEGRTGLGISAVTHGGFGMQGEGVLNLPLVDDHVALRIVGYGAVDPGWMDNPRFGHDLNRSVTWGGRVALRIAPFDGWMVDLTAMAQAIDTRDGQYVYRADRQPVRDVPILEPRHGRTRILQSTIVGSIGSSQLTIASGLTWQTRDDLYDASESVVPLGTPSVAVYDDYRRYLVFDQEIRIGSSPGSRIVWLAGASFMLARTDTYGPLLSGSGPLTGLVAHRRIIEGAVFADGSFPLFDRVRLGFGIRGFRTDTRDDRFANGQFSARVGGLINLTPSATLSYEIAPNQPVYLRFGSAFRPGGLDAANEDTRRYDPDEVRTIDLGGRVRLDGGRLSLDGSLFRTSWENVQSDYLGADGLIATHNVGRADIVGADLSADWKLSGGWRVRAGLLLQRPRLTHGMDGAALPRDTRLPVVPDVSARFGLARDLEVRDWHVTPELSANVMGASRLSFEPDLDRRMPGYVIARFGAVAARGRLGLRLDIDNLFGTRADTSAFGNPLSVRTARQYTPARPRSLSLSASRRF